MNENDTFDGLQVVVKDDGDTVEVELVMELTKDEFDANTGEQNHEIAVGQLERARELIADAIKEFHLEWDMVQGDDWPRAIRVGL